MHMRFCTTAIGLGILAATVAFYWTLRDTSHELELALILVGSLLVALLLVRQFQWAAYAGLCGLGFLASAYLTREGIALGAALIVPASLFAVERIQLRWMRALRRKMRSQLDLGHEDRINTTLAEWASGSIPGFYEAMALCLPVSIGPLLGLLAGTEDPIPQAIWPGVAAWTGGVLIPLLLFWAFLADRAAAVLLTRKSGEGFSAA